MDTTALVTVAGVASTTVVALAGYVFNARRARADHDVARDLARDAQSHERELRRAERVYEARRDTYLELLGWALVLIQQVALTDPIAAFADAPPPPESMSQEDFRRMRAKIGAFGSAEVDLGVTEFLDAVRAFGVQTSIVRTMQDTGSVDIVAAFEKRDAARTEALDSYERLEAVIKSELAA